MFLSHRAWLSLVMSLALLVSLLAGCGGGGAGGGTAAERASTASGGSNGTVRLTVERGAQKVPSETRTVRVVVVGTSISASAPFGPDTTSVTLELLAPLGPQTIRIEALDAAGNVLATSDLQVVVGANEQTTVTVPVDSLVPLSVTPTPTPTPGQLTLRFRVNAPSPVLARVPFAVQVEAVDAAGQLATSFSGAVTVGLLSNPGGDTMSPLTATAANGVAEISGLTLVNPAAGYQLVAKASGATSATSNVFDVVSGSLQFTVQPSAIQPLNQPMLPQPGGIQVSVVDANGKVLDVSVPVLMQAYSGAPLTLGGTVQADTVHGVATFTDLRMTASGRNQLVAVAGPRSANIVATSTVFGVGPAMATGKAYLLLSGNRGAVSLGAYDLATGLPTTTPQTLAYSPVGLSVWPGNASSGPLIVIIGTDAQVHFHDATTLAPVGTALALPIGSPQVIKRNTSNDLFYITYRSDGDLVVTLDMSTWPTPTTLAASSLSSFNVHGLAVDPAPAPTFVVDAGTSSSGLLELWTISGNTLVSPTSTTAILPDGSDTHIDLAYADTLAVGMITFGTQTPAGSDGIFVSSAAAGSLDASPTAFTSFVSGATASDIRGDVRFYASTAGLPTSTATALVTNRTTNRVEVAVCTATAPVGAKPRLATTLAGDVVANVVDPDSQISNPGPLGLATDATGRFVLGLVTCGGSNGVPLVDLTQPTPAIYGAIALPPGTIAFGVAVWQAGQRITGQ